MYLKSIGHETLKIYVNGKIVVISFTDEDSIAMSEHIIRMLAASFIKKQMHKNRFDVGGRNYSEEDNR